MRRTAALIVGGGPAGAAAAILLARGGARPLLLERHAEPQDALCGGFLGWDALAALDRLGLDTRNLGAQPIARVRIVAGDRTAEARLPGGAAGLSRRTLDAALLALARKAGAEVARGSLVRRIAPESLTAEIDGDAIAAEALFLASGKHELRGVARPKEAAGQDPALGLRTRFIPDAATRTALAGVIELHLLRDGYAGLLLQEDGRANLCLSIGESRLRAAGGDPAACVAALAREAPRLIDRLSEPGPWQSVSRIPYGWSSGTTTPGLFRLGDQAAVIASLAGDGVAIALTSGARAAQAYLPDGPAAAAAFQRGFARSARRPIGIAERLRAAAQSPAQARALLPWLGRVPRLLPMLAALTRIA